MTGSQTSSSARTVFDQPPAWPLRALLAAPRFLYRLGLGGLLGHRFLEVEHRGRRSGRLRRTVLEVISYDPVAPESVVIAAWGPRSHWFRNVAAGGAVEVRTAGQRFAADHRILSEAEARQTLAAYERAHPIAVRALRGLFGLRPGDRFADLAPRMPTIAFRPRAAATTFATERPTGSARAASGRPAPWRRVRTGDPDDHQILRVREDVFADPRDGSEHTRVIIEADDWANVVALTADDRVVLVRQFRFGSQSDGLEIPSGVVDADETPAQAAARELDEETGFRAASIEPLGWLWPNPAHFTNKQHTFLARGCERVHDGTPDGSEDLVVELVPRSAIPDLIRAGEIRHALHVAALCLALVAEDADQR